MPSKPWSQPVFAPLGVAGFSAPDGRSRPLDVTDPTPARAAGPVANDGSPGPGARPIFIALDLGTNNCRMLAARPDPRGGFRVVDSFSRITRLGAGLQDTGRLSDAAMDRTVEALKACARKMARHRVTGSRMVATAACRRAANTAPFLDRVERETGLRLEVISADEEARLALAGCAALLRPASVPSGALVFDIGGGSTELMWVENDPGEPAAPNGPRANGFRLVDLVSLPLGVVTVAESRGGDLCEQTYDAVKDEVRSVLAAFDRRHGVSERIASGESVQMLGTSGTVTTLGGVMLDLPRYDRDSVDGLEVDFISIAAVSRRLRYMTCADRARHPCIGRDRADLVVSGCAILEAICETWPVGRLRIADRGIREGVLTDLMRESGVLA